MWGPVVHMGNYIFSDPSSALTSSAIFLVLLNNQTLSICILYWGVNNQFMILYMHDEILKGDLYINNYKSHWQYTARQLPFVSLTS